MENNAAKSLPQTINHLIIDTGNLLTLESFKRKASSLPTEEIAEGINSVIKHFKLNGNLKIDNFAILSDSHNKSSINGERDSVRITVKLFTYDYNECDVVSDAVDIVLNELNTNLIDSLILSVNTSRSTKLSLDEIKPVWQCAQNVFIGGKVSELGISDLDTTQLQQLYEWANTAHISKPTTNHINLEACCVIPPEMSAYAKQHNIQLLTHNDPRGFVEEERLCAILSDLVTDATVWKRHWIARYTIIVAGKGIIQSKGYILSIKKQ